MSWDQSQHPIQLKSSLPDNTLIVVNVTGVETINDDYHCQVKVIAEQALDPATLQKLQGQPLMIHYNDGVQEQYIFGLLASYKTLAVHADHRRAEYELQLASVWSPLRANAPKRYFNNKTCLQILNTVFNDYSHLQFATETHNTTKSLEISLQRNETDWDFVRRLLREAKLFYAVSHSQQKACWRLVDRTSQLPLRNDVLQLSDPVLEMPCFWSWQPVLKQTGLEVQCQTNRFLRAGERVQVKGHVNPADDGVYYVQRVQYQLYDRSYYTDQHKNKVESEPPLQVRAVLIPIKQAFLQPQPDQNRLQPFERALANADEQAPMYTDKQMRLRAKYPWDVTDSEALTSSAWVRTKQWVAGAHWGAQILPRSQQELVVAYTDGDMRKPISLGAVYNSLQTLPFDKPERSGIQTQILGDSALRGHKLIFDDSAQYKAQIWHAERQYNQTVNNNMQVRVGLDWQTLIGYGLKFTAKSITKAAKHRLVLQVGGSQISVLDGHMTIKAQDVKFN